MRLVGTWNFSFIEHILDHVVVASTQRGIGVSPTPQIIPETPFTSRNIQQINYEPMDTFTKA
jgi:hypothetical protein